MRGGRVTRLTDEQKARIRELYAQDKTYKEIAEIVGCSVTAAWVYSQKPENLAKFKAAHHRWYVRHRK